MPRYTIKSEPVLFGPPNGKGRWEVRQGWVVHEGDKQIAAFATEREATDFRDDLEDGRSNADDAEKEN